MRQATFETTYPPEAAHPFHRRLMADGPVARMDLLIWGPTADVTTLSWFDARPGAVASVLDAAESTTETRLVAGDDGTYAFVHQTDYELPDAVLSVVGGSRVVFVPPVRFDESGTVRFAAVGESDALGEFYAGLKELFPTEIVRVGAFTRWSEPAAPTERQREAIEAGVAVGYYDVPRSGSVEDVAAELDCAPSTAGELLRRGESAVLSAFARDD